MVGSFDSAADGLELKPVLRRRGHAAPGGLRRPRLVHDEKVIPDISEQPVTAVCLDGVAAIGSSRAEAASQLGPARGAFNEAGLQRKNMKLPAAEQMFMGLVSDNDRGRISLGRSRAWKIRRALFCQACQRFASGSELARLVGHFNCAALIRRPLRYAFQSSNRFIKKASDNHWRI